MTLEPIEKFSLNNCRHMISTFRLMEHIISSRFNPNRVKSTPYCNNLVLCDFVVDQSAFSINKNKYKVDKGITKYTIQFVVHKCRLLNYSIFTAQVITISAPIFCQSIQASVPFAFYLLSLVPQSSIFTFLLPSFLQPLQMFVSFRILPLNFHI